MALTRCLSDGTFTRKRRSIVLYKMRLVLFEDKEKKKIYSINVMILKFKFDLFLPYDVNIKMYLDFSTQSQKVQKE